jgi:histidyl-tRNA synthetase
MSDRSIQAPRGFKDLLPDDLPRFKRLEGLAHDLAARFGYREIRPPLLEETVLFRRSVGEVTDIVEKEMFTFEREEHSLTLRPEGTAGVVRAYLQAGWPMNQPFQKLYYVGPMFRYERPQKGRERQFTQFGVECLGSLDPRLDVEAIALAGLFFEELGIPGVEVRLNSMGDGEDRDRYREAVRAHVAARLSKYSEDSQARFQRNVLRILDSKDPRDVEQNQDAPVLLEFLSPENRAHFEAVQQGLERIGLPVQVDPKIVRGLDYYTRTVFELHFPALGARSALCGGGRYDHLVEELGGPPTGAVGFAVGFTGTLLTLEQLGLLREERPPAAFVYVASTDDSLEGEALAIAHELRRAGLSAVFDAQKRKFKKQLEQAAKGGHAVLLILGSAELERGVVALKDLRSAEQREVPRAALATELKRLAGRA